MTNWKPGDRAMVIIQGDDPQYGPGRYWLRGEGCPAYSAHAGCLHPIPPPDPHAELKEAVVIAMMAWCEAPAAPPNKMQVWPHSVVDACNALLAAQRQPDLVAELRRAIEEMRCGERDAGREVDRLLAALEAERGGRKG